jgi:hypothetical protein
MNAMNQITFAAEPLIIQATDSQAPATCKGVAYSGQPMQLGAYGETVVNVAGMELPDRVSLLLDHTNEVSAVAGSARPYIEGGKLLIDGIIARGTPAGDQVIALAAAETPLQLSIGAKPVFVESIGAGRHVRTNGRDFVASKAGMKHVIKSQLREITITPLGADSATEISIAAQHNGEGMEATISIEEVKKIDETVNTFQSHVDRRILAEWKADMLEGRATREDVLQRGIEAMQNASELDAIRESRVKNPVRFIPGGTPAIHAKSSLPDSGLQAVEAAILIRAGHESTAEKEYGERVCDSLNGLHRASFPDLMATSLRAVGESVPHDRDQMIRAALSNHSIQVAISNAANLSIVGPYREARRTFPAFAARKSASDFKIHTGCRLNDGFNLEQVAKGGELHHGVAGESTYTYSVDTYGKMFTIDRKDLVNDSVRIFDEVGPAMGRSAARMEGDVFYRALFAAGSSYFHSSLGNLVSGGSSPLSVTSLTTAIAAMRKQRSDTNDDLDISPAVLCVPPELEYTAKGILESEQLQRLTSTDQLPSGNPLRNQLTLQVESRLSNTTKFTSGASTTAWYLFGAPIDMPMIFAYLNDRDAPVVEFFGLDNEAKTLAVTYRVYHDFGAALAEYRAAYKSAGA